MKIFTVLGTLCLSDKEKWAKYTYDNNLSQKFTLAKSKYTNMFPLLIDNFGSKNVFSIYTDEAKRKQQETLSYEFEKNFIYNFDEKYRIIDDKDFNETFKILNKVIDIANKEEVILDLTHSFRHIPILATIALISRNLQGTKNIKHIFFAKEIEKIKEYQIIDLKDYLEIANLSIMLENFSQNYTITSKIKFQNKDYQELARALEQISNNILSNSIKHLYEANFLRNTKNKLEIVSKQKIFLGYKSSIDKTISHVNYLLSLENNSSSKMLFEFSIVLKDKGYLLNALTMLYEAVGFYCIDGLKNLSFEIRDSFDAFLKTNNIKKNYLLSNFSLNMVQHKGRIKRGSSENKILKKYYDSMIRESLKSIPNIKEFEKYIKRIRDFRNNLTHANSSDEIKNSKDILEKLQKDFEVFCIKKDILQTCSPNP